MTKTSWIVGSLAIALISCSPAVPKKQVVPNDKNEVVSADTGIEFWDPKLDILFIIDNSGSMQTHQRNLSMNVGRFVTSFTSKVQLDFHIGVISTDNDYYATKDCCGRLIGTPNFLQNNTPNFQRLLTQRMLLGIYGSGTEKVFDPLSLALAEPNLSGPNLNFLRPDAFLAVIVITDAEDQSLNAGPDDTFDMLLRLKNGKLDRVLSYGVIVPSGKSDCSRDEPDREPRRIEAFLAKTVTAGNNIFSLCAADFGDRLVNVGKDLARRVGSSFQLNRIPVPGSIVVTFGTQTIERDPTKGWAFDASTNTVLLGNEIVWSQQPAGTRVKVKYEAMSN